MIIPVGAQPFPAANVCCKRIFCAKYLKNAGKTAYIRHKYEALNMAHEKYYAPDNIEKFKEMFGGKENFKRGNI